MATSYTTILPPRQRFADAAKFGSWVKQRLDLRNRILIQRTSRFA
jgi:hypothetical protein